MGNILYFLFAANVAVLAPDCGESANKAIIQKTQSLVIRSSEPVYKSELVNADPSFVCVRFTFNIDSKGYAANIKAAEGNYSRAFNIAAIRALQKYQFRTMTGSSTDTFMLVFRPKPLM